MFVFFFFFFSSRRRHTRWNCDWSSDVCSSDLVVAGDDEAAVGGVQAARLVGVGVAELDHDELVPLEVDGVALEIGRASCRERVEVWVVGGLLKKKESGVVN